MKSMDLFSKTSRSENYCLPCVMLNPRNKVTIRKKMHTQFGLTNIETRRNQTNLILSALLTPFNAEGKSNGHTNTICISHHHVSTTTNYCTMWLIVLQCVGKLSVPTKQNWHQAVVTCYRYGIWLTRLQLQGRHWRDACLGEQWSINHKTQVQFLENLHEA